MGKQITYRGEGRPTMEDAKMQAGIRENVPNDQIKILEIRSSAAPEDKDKVFFITYEKLVPESFAS